MERMTTYERIEKVIRYVDEHREEQPGLEELARVAGLSPHHFHRLFSRWAGTTPKDFLKYLTNEHAKALLEGSADVLTASIEAGLSGPGRLHDLLVSVEGVTPGEYKSGGAGVAIRYGVHDTPFGPALLGVTKRGLCHLSFNKDLSDLRRRWPKADLIADQAATKAAARAIFEKRAGKLGVVLRGTPFQLKVWEALLRIPKGKAASYAQVAAAVGKPKATRAVGTAVGANPIAVLIPCHRVLRGGGLLGGYRWGLARKRAILAWEASARR